MKRRWRGPAIWIGLGVIAVLAYLAIQPVPVSMNGYEPPVTTAATADPAPPASVAPAPLTPEPAAPVITDIPGFIPLPPLPEPAPAPAATPARSPVMYVTATSLNLRAAPEATAAVLERLDRGQPVDVVGAATGWFEVINPASGTRGWMSAEYLSDQAPGTTTAPTATPAFGQPATPTFGQPATPAFGQPATPTFGQPAPAEPAPGPVQLPALY